MNVKQIHIEKYDIESFEKEKKPYTMVLTDVIQRISMQHSQAFLLWVYLESMPGTWKPCKNHLTKHFDIGDRTYERHMSWLNAVGLIEYRQNRQEDGSFGKGKLIVLNGTNFNPDAVSTRSAKIGGAVVSRLKTRKLSTENTNSKKSAKKPPEAASSKTKEHFHRSAKLPLNGSAVERRNVAHINKTNKPNKSDKKKTNNKGENPVSIFSDKDSVKNHIEKVLANRGDFVEDDIVDQGIYYAFETNSDKSFDSVNKRINIFLMLVRKGKWNIPQGFNGITSKSIREKEENHYAEKQIQYQQEAQAFKEITKNISGIGHKNFSEEMKKMFG